MKKWKRIFCTLLSAAMLLGILAPTVCAAESVLLDLPEGCYTFSSRLNNHQFIDVNGNGIENGTNIQLWEQNGTQAQMFYVSKVSGGWYSIRNINSRKALDVAGGVTGSGINVQLYDWNGTDAQLWCFISAGNGGYYIKNKLGFYMDAAGGQSESGTNIQVYTGNGTNAQIWEAVPVSGLYRLTTGVDSGMRLDVNGNYTDNGTNIQIWSANDSGAQIFCVVKESNDWFSIRHSASRKAIDVAGGVSGNGVNVQLYDWNGTDAQLWRFISAGNGSYYIQNKLGYYLDVSDGKNADGTNVQVCHLNDSRAQMWRIESADLKKEITAKVLVSLHFDRTSEMTVLEKLLYYYTHFNHGKKYDIKRRDSWNALFGDIAYPGANGVVLCGGFITPEQLGNIIYGFVGKSMGFNETLIYQGGGYAANKLLYINNKSMYYGDSAMDHEFISIGIGLSGTPTTVDLTFPEIPFALKTIAAGVL